MKKYNLSSIMRRAWAEAKAEKKKFEGWAKVLIEDEVLAACKSKSSYFVFKLWEKGPHRRIYVNDYKYRSVAYIDLNDNNEIVSDYGDRSYQVATIHKFMGTYEF